MFFDYPGNPGTFDENPEIARFICPMATGNILNVAGIA